MTRRFALVPSPLVGDATFGLLQPESVVDRLDALDDMLEVNS